MKMVSMKMMKQLFFVTVGLLTLAVSGFAETLIDWDLSQSGTSHIWQIGQSGAPSVSQQPQYVRIQASGVGGLSGMYTGLLGAASTPTAGTAYTTAISDQLTVTMDLSVNISAASNVGIYFVNSKNLAQGIGAVYTLDASGLNESARFYQNPTTYSTSGAGTQVGTTQNLADLTALGEKFTLSVKLDLSGASPTLKLGLNGTQIASQAFTYDFSGWESASIVFRDSNANPAGYVNSNTYLYSFKLESIPEPSALALLGIGAGLLIFLRKRGKK